MRGRTDARGPRHVEPEVAVAGDLWLPVCNPIASACRAGEPALCIGRRSNGIARARERNEEGLRLAIDDDAAVRGDGIEQDAFVFGDRRAVIATKLLLQSGRAFDVREKERHSSFRQAGHSSKCVTGGWPGRGLSAKGSPTASPG